MAIVAGYEPHRSVPYRARSLKHSTPSNTNSNLNLNPRVFVYADLCDL